MIEAIKKKLEADLEIAARATKGPWYVWEETWVMTSIPGDEAGTNRVACQTEFDLGGPERAEFIAHTRNTYEANTRALLMAIEALERFADYDNPNEPKNVCWPASEYIKQARKALDKIIGEKA